MKSWLALSADHTPSSYRPPATADARPSVSSELSWPFISWISFANSSRMLSSALSVSEPSPILTVIERESPSVPAILTLT